MSGSQKLQLGQSMIEVLAALAVVIIVLVGLVGGVTYSVRNASFARDQSLATQSAQKLIEEAREKRDDDPEGFFADVDGQCDLSLVKEGIFYKKRECTFDFVTNAVTVVVTVAFPEEAGPHGSKLETTLTNWK